MTKAASQHKISIGKLVWNRLRYVAIDRSRPLGHIERTIFELARQNQKISAQAIRGLYRFLPKDRTSLLLNTSVYSADFGLIYTLCLNALASKRALPKTFLWEIETALLSLIFTGYIDATAFLKCFTQNQLTLDDFTEILKRAFDNLYQQKFKCPTAQLPRLAQSLKDIAALNPLVTLKIAQVELLFSAQKNEQMTTEVLIEKQIYEFYEPEVIGESDARVHRKVEIPTFTLTRAKSAIVIGANQVLQGEKLLIYDLGGRPQNHLVAGAWRHSLPITDDLSHCICFDISTKVLHLEKAILLPGRTPSNYFHWLIEYLPKLLIFQLRPDELQNIPILAQTEMAPTQFESLEIALKKLKISNPVVKKDHHTRVEVDELFLPSNPVFNPDIYDREFWPGNGLSLIHMKFLRNLFLPAKRRSQSPKKIFLSRKSGLARGIINLREVEDLLKENGFSIIYPEDLRFSEQVQMIYDADLICAPGGAALSNLAFCHPGTQVIGLVAAQNRSYCMQANIAEFSGCQFGYVLGLAQFPRDYYLTESAYIHANFAVDLQQLNQALKRTASLAK